MAVTYDKHYQTVNLFGEPYPELIDFFDAIQEKGKLLDLGCGQGRDAIALARIGYDVTGVDSSRVGIEQMNRIASEEKLMLEGIVADIYEFKNFRSFDIVLMDSMFHFAKPDKEREIAFIKRVLAEIKLGGLFVVCIQDVGSKVKILRDTLALYKKIKLVADKHFTYTFHDNESGHKLEMNYRMIAMRK